MTRSLNRVELIGNLGVDPEIRTTSNGARVATFSLATSRQWTSAAGEKQEKTEWHKCVAWDGKSGNGLASIIERYVGKGDKLYVAGRIEYRQYEDKDKVSRYVTEINVTELLMLGGGQRNSDAPRKQRSGHAGGDAETQLGSDGFEEFPAAREGDDDLPW